MDKRIYLSTLFNFVQNSIKFSKRNGSLAIIVRVEDEQFKFGTDLQSQAQLNLVTTVKDGGVGISKMTLAQINSNLQSKNYTESSGYCSGLMVAKQLIDAQRGALHLKSTEGVGTKV